MSFMAFVVDVFWWLWASKWIVLGVYLAALVFVYALFRLLLAYNEFHYNVMRQIQPKFNEHYQAYLKDLTARQVRKGYQADEDIVAVSEFLSEREITRKGMN